ncbi:flagellar hook-associated protein 2 [Polaromonas sp. OV174]|uniref:flagellar filament capping protein FliD n=1 Tax=Polaromonas sp. OV174 TaxID=1855300 RepID=UPI0008EE527C|nr:flagellar filament capping protein FliD [Polaromonas sp. OV174]SFC69923.1 flagellar hook-associated protein 2 [Polaromonas sp. OV174]
MASVSSLGIGSGLDLNTLLANLKKGEQAPLVALQQQQTSYTTKLTAYGKLGSALSALQTAAAALAKPDLFQGVKAGSTASDVLTATALSTAQSGTYAVNVTQMSQAQSLAAAGVATSNTNIGDVVAAATPTTVTFEFGTTTGASFAADADATRTKSIDIDPAHSSLADIAKKINDAAIGVTASIVNDGSASPYRLVLTSKQTGEASSMRITVSGDADHPAGDAALSSLLTNNPAGPKLEQTAAAQNTKLTVNGIAITSATNSVAGAVQDVTMTVSKLGSSTLSVQQDAGIVQNAVAAFVNAYNSLQGVAKQLTAFDASSKTGAVLMGDSTLRNIQVGIRSALTAAQSDDGSGLTTLSQIGVSFQKDGSLALDSTKLTAALNGKMSGVAHLFSGGAGSYGAKMAALITGYTDTTGGSLAMATKGINTTLDSLAKQYTATSDRVDATVARYKAQFTQLDVLINSMNQTSSYLTQQFDALNNNSK